MKYILSVTILLITYLSSAQTNNAIQGRYHRSQRGEPLGGNDLFIFENHQYVITYFGGAQVGRWEMENDMILFSPSRSLHPFALYGRHNTSLGDSMRIFFNGFYKDETFIRAGIATATPVTMQRVFNVSPNCFGFPYVHIFPAAADSIAFAGKIYIDPREDKSTTQTIYNFANPDGYNDFIAYYFSPRYQEKNFRALYKENRLYFREDEYAEKKPLPTKGEDHEFLLQLQQANLNPDTVLFNPWYKQAGKEVYDTFNYRYDTAKGAYINLFNYKEGEEHIKEDDSFNRMFIVYPFHLLQQVKTEKQFFYINETPLFVARCGEEEQ